MHIHQSSYDTFLFLRAQANSRWKGCTVRVQEAKPDFEARRIADLEDAAAIVARGIARKTAMELHKAPKR